MVGHGAPGSEDLRTDMANAVRGASRSCEGAACGDGKVGHSGGATYLGKTEEWREVITP